MIDERIYMALESIEARMNEVAAQLRITRRKDNTKQQMEMLHASKQLEALADRLGKVYEIMRKLDERETSTT